MPKIKTRNFKHTNAAGETLAFKSDITVDSEGLFSATVPDDVATAALSLRSKVGKAFWVTQPRQNHRITGRDLATVERSVEEAMQELLSVETTTERVIVYSHKVDVSAWQNSDGSLHANGHIGERREDGGEWHPMGDHMDAARRTSHFRVGLYAEVLDKVTHTRANSVRTEFRSPEWEHSHLSYETWGSKLNGFATLDRPRNPGDLPSLPYTEENARFFYEMLIALCYLGRNLHDFFADQQNVVQAIERGSMPLLAGHQAKEEA